MTTDPLFPHRFHVPTEIRFGAGALEQLAACSEAMGATPFLVTGRRSVRASGVLDRALAMLPRAVHFDAIDENPTTEMCDAAAAACRAGGCDHVVAIGGGSPMDVAKAVAGLARHEGPCAGFFGRDTFPNGALPVIAVPTTAGTGSEVTPYAVLVRTDEERKQTIGGRCLFPSVALLDPELTRTLSPGLTAATGLDALSQAMEGFVSKKRTPLGNALALDACRRIRRWLPVAAADGANLEARSQVLYAAMLSGCIIAQSGTTLVHGMGYHYTLTHGVQHGLANGLLLAPVFAFNATQAPEAVATLAEALGVRCDPKPDAAAKAIAGAIHELLRACGVSPAARDAGVRADTLEAFAEDIASDPYRVRNQIGEISVALVRRLYHASYAGAPE